MKQTRPWSGLLAIGSAALLSMPAYALNTDAEHLRKKGYLPLAGSGWALAHPGELPYEQCAIKAGWIGDSLYGVTAVAGIGTGGLDGAAGFFESPQLVCWTKSLKLAFKIPVLLGRYSHIGASLAMSHIFPNRIRLSRLDGNRVGGIFGDYYGGEQAVIVGFGFGGMVLRNGAGVQLTSASGRAGLGVINGYTTLSLAARRSVERASYLNECRDDEFLLMKGTESERSATDCYESVSYGNRAFPDHSRPKPVDLEALMPYRFVRIGSR